MRTQSVAHPWSERHEVLLFPPLAPRGGEKGAEVRPFATPMNAVAHVYRR